MPSSFLGKFVPQAGLVQTLRDSAALVFGIQSVQPMPPPSEVSLAKRNLSLVDAGLENGVANSLLATQGLLQMSKMKIPQGDGRSVMLLHGFGDTGISTQPLRNLLGKNGYRVLDQPYGLNTGNAMQHYTSAKNAVLEEYRRTGRPVTVIGDSLGAFYTRCIAIEHPEAVETAVQISGPHNFDDVQPLLKFMSNFMLGSYEDQFESAQLLTPQNLTGEIPAGPRVIAITTRQDGIVGLPSQYDPAAENYSVAGTHVTALVNPSIIRFLAGTNGILQQPLRPV